MFLDTSSITAMFAGERRGKRVEKFVYSQTPYVSELQVAEVAEWALRIGVSPEDRVGAVRDMARVLPLTQEVCVEGARIKKARREDGYARFGIMDGMILAAARSINQTLVTLDGDFEGEKDCIVLR